MRIPRHILIVALALTAALASAQTAQTPAAQPPVAQKIAAGKNLLDLNTANLEDLKKLPGIGDAYAQRIIAGRPYTEKNQLVGRGILPVASYDKIKDQIIAHRQKK
jgi:competence protein ComEA